MELVPPSGTCTLPTVFNLRGWFCCSYFPSQTLGRPQCQRVYPCNSDQATYSPVQLDYPPQWPLDLLHIVCHSYSVLNIGCFKSAEITQKLLELF